MMTSDQAGEPDPKWGKPDLFHDPYILANFRARTSDILITTAPKAGTTWMQQILHQVRSGGDESFNNIDDVVPWLERPRADISWQERLSIYEQIDNPRIFKTHCTYEQTPGVETARIILTSRDPRDCCVSFYHHMMNLTDESCEKMGFSKPSSFDEYFEFWKNAGTWYRNVKSWWPHIQRENILWLRYEDMKNGLEEPVHKILRFLNWTLNQSQWETVLHYISFDYMKQHADKFAAINDNNKSFFKPGTFIRKGAVGDHLNLLSPEQATEIMHKAHAELEPECLKFLELY